MTRPPADQSLRDQALDVDRSVIVRAPAGSGKTTLLTQRFLALLARVDAPEEIVAITFTRKAAAEMHQRIVVALRRAAEDAEAASPLAVAALVRDRARGWGLTEHPARLRVETIDAFAGSIAAALPLSSGLGGPAAITDDAEPLYRDAVRQLLADLEQPLPWRTALERVLAHLDNDHRRFEELLTAMLWRRDQWLRLLRGEADGTAMEATVARLIRDEITRVRERIPNTTVAALIDLARYAGGHLARHKPEYAGVRLADLEELPAATAERLRDWVALADLVLTSDGGWRRALRIDNGFPPRKTAPDADRRKAELLDLIAEFAQVPGLDAAWAGLRELPEPNLDPAHAELTEALLHLLKTAAAYLEVVFDERGVSDFTRVALAAEQALGEPERPTDLSLALDHRLSHLLVDEFQDTSVTQFELLLRLTAGWQPGDGRTLFLVGDPLQSIYRFREANVYLFEQVVRLGRLGTVPLKVLALRANFRSQPALIGWLNDNFPRLNAPVDTLHVREVAYTPVDAEVAADGAAGVFVHAGRDVRHDERADLVALIVRLVQDDPRQTIAVLARGRAHAEGLAAMLLARGVAVRAGDVDGPAESPVVRDLLALSRALAHPADRVAWLSVLRAPWCGLALADLARLTELDMGKEVAVVRDLLADDSLVARLSVDGQHRVRRVRDVLDGLPRAAIRGFHELVEAAWIELGGPACLVSDLEFDEAAQFFDRLAGLTAERRLPSPATLARAMSQLRARDTASDTGAVILTTIHKAKGLEFDVVIIPATEKTVMRDSHRLLEWTEIVWPDNETALLFAPIPEPGNSVASERAWSDLIRKRERLEQALETRRLLYVALTRAKREVHLFGTLPEGAEPPADSLLRLLWPVVADAFAQGTAGTDAASTADAASGSTPLVRLAADWRAPEPLPGLPVPAAVAQPLTTPVEYSWAGIRAKHVGTIVHECLRLIGVEGVEQWSRQRLDGMRSPLLRRARSLGLVGAAGDEAIDLAISALEGAVEDPRGRWILSGQHRDAAAELRVSGIVGDRLVQAVIDRSFIDTDRVRWVIDYKTSTHSGGALEAFLDSECERYRAQLERYAALVSATSGEPIRLGLYFPLLLQWREWPFAVGP